MTWRLRNSLFSSACAVFFCDLALHSLAWVLFWVSLYWFISDMMPVKQLHFHPYIIICSVFLWSCIPLSGFKLPYLNWDLFWVSSRWFLSDMRPVKQLQGHVFCCRLTYCLLSHLDCPSWRLARVGVVGCTSVLLVSQRSLSCCCQLAPDLDQLGLLCLSNESVLCNYSPLSMQRLIKLWLPFSVVSCFCFVFLANLLLSHHSALAFFIKKNYWRKEKEKVGLIGGTVD